MSNSLSWVKCFNILVMWGTIWPLWMIMQVHEPQWDVVYWDVDTF